MESQAYAVPSPPPPWRQGHLSPEAFQVWQNKLQVTPVLVLQLLMHFLPCIPTQSQDLIQAWLNGPKCINIICGFLWMVYCCHLLRQMMLFWALYIHLFWPLCMAHTHSNPCIFNAHVHCPYTHVNSSWTYFGCKALLLLQILLDLVIKKVGFTLYNC